MKKFFAALLLAALPALGLAQSPATNVQINLSTNSWQTTQGMKLKAKVNPIIFGADPSGATDSTVAINAAIAFAVAQGGGIVHIPAGQYKISELNLAGKTNVSLEGDGSYATMLIANASSNSMIDLSGSYACDVSQMSLQNSISSGFTPKVGILMCQVAADSGNLERLGPSLVINGSFSVAGLYIYGEPSNRVFQIQIINYYPTGAAGMYMTSSNAQSMTSDFVTVATGTLNTGDWDFHGCEFHELGISVSDTTSQAVRLDGAYNVHFFGGNMSIGSKTAACSGVVWLENSANAIGIYGTQFYHDSGTTPLSEIYMKSGTSVAISVDNVQWDTATLIQAVSGITLAELGVTGLERAGTTGGGATIISPVSGNITLSNPFIQAYGDAISVGSGGTITAGILLNPGTITASTNTAVSFTSGVATITAPLTISAGGNALNVTGGNAVIAGLTEYSNGSSTAPSSVFSNATTTGTYWANPGIGFSVAGASVGTWTATGLGITGTLTPTGNIINANGSASTPSDVFTGGATTGLYWANPGIGFSVAASSVGTMTATGLNNMAIGATNANTGAFTTLSATGAATLSSTLAMGGTAINAGALPSGATTLGALATFGAQTYTVTGTNTATAYQGIYNGVVTVTDASAGTVTDLFDETWAGPAAVAGSLVGTRKHTIGILDSTSAASSITGGFIVATAYGTAATSVGVGGGNVYAGGTVTGNQLTSTVAIGTAPLIVTSTTNVPNLNASTLSGATFAAPGPIGSTTASTGAFSTLSSTGVFTVDSGNTTPSNPGSNGVAYAGAVVADGLYLIGKGSSYDVSLWDSAGTAFLYNATGTTNVTMPGDVTISGGGNGLTISGGNISVTSGGPVGLGSGLTTAGTLAVTGKATSYNGVTTAGWGLEEIVGAGRQTGQTGADTTITSYSLPATDSSFEVSANINVTTYVSGTFTTTCTYTDEGNTSRTLTLNFSNIAGTLATAVAAAGAFEGVPMHIRCKASTTITLATTGTFTSLTYNAEGVIRQLQ